MPTKTNRSRPPRKTSPPPSRRTTARPTTPAKPAAPTAAARLAIAQLNVRQNRRVLRLVRQAEALARQTDRAFTRAEGAAVELLHSLARRSDRVVISRAAVVESRNETIEAEQTIERLNGRIVELEKELSNAMTTIERTIGDGAELARAFERLADEVTDVLEPPTPDDSAAPAAAGKS